MHGLLLVLAAATAPEAAHAVPAAMSQDPPKGIARARDGNIAIREELEAARKKHTVAAYDLFIARHPHHRLAGIARKERARLLRTTGQH